MSYISERQLQLRAARTPPSPPGFGETKLHVHEYFYLQTHESPVFPELSHHNHLDRAWTEEGDTSVLSPTSDLTNTHVSSWLTDRKPSLPFS